MRYLTLVVAMLCSIHGFAAELSDFNPQLAKKLVVEEGALLLDVRSEREFMAGSLKNAKHIPYTEIKDRVDEILKLQNGEKGKPIVVFCAVGGRASKAKATLQTLGFTKVTNLGGIKDWPSNTQK